MILELDMTGSEPIYQQIRDQIVLGLAKNELQLNEALPSVRQLADDIGINMMTVSKAYNLLKEQGYVEIDRRQGTRIVSSLQEPTNFEATLKKQLTLLLAEASLNNLSQEKIQEISRDIFRDFTRED